jgi:hypothetical protein
VVGGPANAKRPDREYLPLTDAVIEAHLSGRTHVGLYPLLPDDSCRLLVCDFDGPSRPLDARARASGVAARDRPTVTPSTTGRQLDAVAGT